MASVGTKSPTISAHSRKIRTPSATVSRPGTSTPIVITSFAMKDCADFNPDSIQMLCPMDFEIIMDKLKDCDAIKYAAYRTATKLDILRTALRLDQVRLGAVTSAFHQHGFRTALTDARFDASKATDVIADIFFSAGKIRPYYNPTIDVSACTEVCRRIAFAIFGEENIGVSFLKVFFTILCEARLKDKLAYLHKDFVDSGGKCLLSKKGIKAMLVELTRISDFLGESSSFGSHLVDSTVAQCLHVSNLKLLDEDAFFKWIFKEPELIVWLPTFYRMIASKSIRHDVSCSACKSGVIIGMRYQCLLCINYDLCQHCFFYGLTSQSHKISHPMQEYCYKSTRKEATRAWLKVFTNNLKDRKLFKKPKFRRRYLPHDPKMVLENTFNETIEEQPVTVEALNLHPMLHSEALGGGEACSSGFHSVSSNSQSPVQNEKRDFKERQTQLNSILMNIEKENSAVLERLTSLQASRNKIKSLILEEQNLKTTNSNPVESLTQPIDSCVAMQAQLNRLKLLMEGLFEFEEQDENGCETPMRTKKQIADQRQSILLELQNSLNEPSLIESTPMVTANQLKGGNKHLSNAMANHQFHKKKLSRLALDNNFSPIVFQSPKSIIPSTPVFDESVVVETLLASNNEVNPETVVDAGSPTLSKVTMGDITSFLAKSGQNHQNFDQNMDITKHLITPAEEKELQDCNGDLMEEMDKIMTKMENIMSTFQDPSLIKKALPVMSSISDLGTEFSPSIIGQLVAEISDLIHAHAMRQ